MLAQAPQASGAVREESGMIALTHNCGEAIFMACYEVEDRIEVFYHRAWPDQNTPAGPVVNCPKCGKRLERTALRPQSPVYGSPWCPGPMLPLDTPPDKGPGDAESDFGDAARQSW